MLRDTPERSVIACAATGGRPASNGPPPLTTACATSSGWPKRSSDLRTTSASELLAALICAQPLDGDHLAATITTYRQAGRDTMGAVGSGDLNLPQTPRRGRPRRKWIKNSHRAGGGTHEPPSEHPS